MVKLWGRWTKAHRVAAAILVLALVVLIGGVIWHYSTWPASVLIVVALVVNAIGRSPGARNPQENDPNRR